MGYQDLAPLLQTGATLTNNPISRTYWRGWMRLLFRMLHQLISAKSTFLLFPTPQEFISVTHLNETPVSIFFLMSVNWCQQMIVRRKSRGRNSSSSSSLFLEWKTGFLRKYSVLPGSVEWESRDRKNEFRRLRIPQKPKKERRKKMGRGISKISEKK